MTPNRTATPPAATPGAAMSETFRSYAVWQPEPVAPVERELGARSRMPSESVATIDATVVDSPENHRLGAETHKVPPAPDPALESPHFQSLWHPDLPHEFRNQIITGDARKLAQRLPAASVDLVFTDPVYAHLDDYEWLSKEAARVLKPGGSLLAFVGVNWLQDVLAVTMAIRFRGLFAWNLKGPHNKRYGKTIDNGAWLVWWGGWPKRHTPLVWDSAPWGYETSFHWQKNPRLIQRHIVDFTDVGGCVWEPFCGSGSVPAACFRSGRNFIASEIDPETATLARERVRLTPEPLFVMDAPEPLAFDFAEGAST